MRVGIRGRYASNPSPSGTDWLPPNSKPPQGDTLRNLSIWKKYSPTLKHPCQKRTRANDANKTNCRRSFSCLVKPLASASYQKLTLVKQLFLCFVIKLGKMELARAAYLLLHVSGDSLLADRFPSPRRSSPPSSAGRMPICFLPSQSLTWNKPVRDSVIL